MPNYITVMRAQNDDLRAEIKAKNELIQEFRIFLASSKFHKDTTIQVRDVDDRLVDIMLATGEGRQ